MWWLLALSCVKNSPTPEPRETTTAEPVSVEVDSAVPAEGNITLDGRVRNAHWDDGDTFSYVDSDTGEKVKARLSGFNTLESYGPVHRWGEWTGDGLYRIAKEAGRVAQDGNWTCTQLSGSCGYGRICVSCPDLQATLLSEGLAHVFALKDPADPDMLAHQHAAQAGARGMWARGVPKELVTSLHSLDEKPGSTQTYNRLISTESGASTQLHHSDSYETCSWACPTDSCMRYIPYTKRYGENRAECLTERTSEE